MDSSETGPYNSSDDDHFKDDPILIFDNTRFLLAPIVLTVRLPDSQSGDTDATSVRGTTPVGSISIYIL